MGGGGSWEPGGQRGCLLPATVHLPLPPLTTRTHSHAHTHTHTSGRTHTHTHTPAEELEALLGARPYRSAELRNIDKLKAGFKGGAGGGGAASVSGPHARRAPPACVRRLPAPTQTTAPTQMAA